MGVREEIKTVQHTVMGAVEKLGPVENTGKAVPWDEGRLVSHGVSGRKPVAGKGNRKHELPCQ